MRGVVREDASIDAAEKKLGRPIASRNTEFHRKKIGSIDIDGEGINVILVGKLDGRFGDTGEIVVIAWVFLPQTTRMPTFWVQTKVSKPASTRQARLHAPRGVLSSPTSAKHPSTLLCFRLATCREMGRASMYPFWLCGRGSGQKLTEAECGGVGRAGRRWHLGDG